jgi:hypothetical protein
VTIDLYSFVGMYDRVLTTAGHLLAKGVAHAKATGATEADMLGWRLIDDMQPLSFQLMVVCNFPKQWLARAADLPVPADVEADLDVAGFQAAIAEAKAYLAGLTPAQFEGRDDVPLTVTIGGDMAPTLPAGQWVSVFATTNLFFHLSMAYAILRNRGVALGKRDLFAGGL